MKIFKNGKKKDSMTIKEFMSKLRAHAALTFVISLCAALAIGGIVTAVVRSNSGIRKETREVVNEYHTEAQTDTAQIQSAEEAPEETAPAEDTSGAESVAENAGMMEEELLSVAKRMEEERELLDAIYDTLQQESGEDEEDELVTRLSSIRSTMTRLEQQVGKTLTKLETLSDDAKKEGDGADAAALAERLEELNGHVAKIREKDTLSAEELNTFLAEIKSSGRSYTENTDLTGLISRLEQRVHEDMTVEWDKMSVELQDEIDKKLLAFTEDTVKLLQKEEESRVTAEDLAKSVETLRQQVAALSAQNEQILAALERVSRESASVTVTEIPAASQASSPAPAEEEVITEEVTALADLSEEEVVQVLNRMVEVQAKDIDKNGVTFMNLPTNVELPSQQEGEGEIGGGS